MLYTDRIKASNSPWYKEANLVKKVGQSLDIQAGIQFFGGIKNNGLCLTNLHKARNATLEISQNLPIFTNLQTSPVPLRILVDIIKGQDIGTKLPCT